MYCLRQLHALEPELGVGSQESGEAVWSHATRPTGFVASDSQSGGQAKVLGYSEGLGVSDLKPTRP